MVSAELQDLVDAPRERLDIEYKGWLDTGEKLVRANLARHLCALANHGGGYIVVGIDDDMSPSGRSPNSAVKYDQDTISGIVRRYLAPPFQVAVYSVPSAVTGVIHPVIWVPTHGAVPVCSTRDGPQINGKVEGIARGVHYVRTPGPQSEPVRTPADWAPIIRRCVLHERTALLAGLEPLLRSPGPPVAPEKDPLKLWHEAAHARFLELSDTDPLSDLLKRSHYQFSYQVRSAIPQRMDMSELLRALREARHEVQDLVDPGWNMFWVFDRREIAPYSTDDTTISEPEFLECSHIEDRIQALSLPDFWRVSPAGMATTIRPYREDRRDFGHDCERGKWLSPQLMAQELTEVVRPLALCQSGLKPPRRSPSGRNGGGCKVAN